MNYKETLYFTAKCLTISLEYTNRQEIEKQLKSTSINWENIVKLSTAHYVFSALYFNFKRTDFLKHLPTDLVDYMVYITNLNKDRNRKIIKQAQELNNLLLSNNIRAIFLKGTGNLLAGLYDNIAERMVGDIDLIFSKEDYSKAIDIIRKFGYYEVKKKDYYDPSKKHYRRLKKESNIAAIEIHSRLLDKKKYDQEFNYSFVKKNSQVINDCRVLSFSNKLNLSIIADQINDNGFYFKTMNLRNAYDILLLSKKTNTRDAVNSLNKLSHPLNCFLAACYEVFNKVDTIEYNKNAKTNLYLISFNNQFTQRVKERSNTHKILIFIKKIFYILFMSIGNKEYRVFLFKCLTDKNWYKQKLIQFGIKNKF